MVNVQYNSIHLLVMVELVVLFGVQEKEFLVIKPRQRIAFRRGDRFPVFIELDRTLNTCKDNAGIGIRLRNKVNSTEMQAFDFC